MPVTQDTPDYIQHPPHAYRITSDEEAISIAHEIAAYLQPGAAERDLSGVVPPEVVNTFSNSGLWGITIPREYGGAEVSAATLATVIAIISAADPALGQIPQNHYCLLEDIRLQGSDEQRRFFFELALSGHRFANALSETGGKTVQDIQTRLTRTADGLRINGRKGYCTGSLYAHWLAQGIEPDVQEYALSICHPTAEEAKLLSIPPTASLMKIILRSRDKLGRVLEYGTAICRSDFYHFHFTVKA